MSHTEEKPEASYVFKIALLGAEATGKTSLINKYVQNKFEQDYKPTLGASILTKKISLESPKVDISLVIWDIAGQNKYTQIRQLYFQGCSGVIFVYDMTRESTFTDIREKWIEDFRKFSTPDTVFMLVGNKKDLTDKIKIGTALGIKLAAEIGAVEYIETSAKTGDNVPRMFDMIVRKLFQNLTKKT